jgi:hypothetical protein
MSSIPGSFTCQNVHDVNKWYCFYLKVFAHGSYANLTHEILWNITRGLEDFNNILNGLPKARGKTVFVQEIYHKLEKILQHH